MPYKMLRPGDHVIASNDLYGDLSPFTQVFQPYGIDFFRGYDRSIFVPAGSAHVYQNDLDRDPTNPLLRIVDIRALSTLARNHGALSVVDNTFASPYLQRPLELGADAVMHSATKYLAGHSDVIHGAVAGSNSSIMEQLRFQVKSTGAVPGPWIAT